MKAKYTFVLFALLTVAFSLPACASTPKVSNIHMATDDQGANMTTAFAPTDVFYLFFDVRGVPKGTLFETRWYALNVAGKDPNAPFETMDQNYDGSSTALRFRLTNTSNWPAGKYRVDIYMSGKKLGEVQFGVS